MASSEFSALEHRIRTLKTQFLPAPSATGSHTPEEEDNMRALRALTHAEIEAYLESICTLLVNDLKRELQGSRGLKSTVSTWAREAIRQCETTVASNNGIAEKYIRAMFGCLGIEDSDYDSISPVFLSRMTTYGADRGEVVHKSAMQAQHSLVSQREDRFIEELLGYLKTFDQLLLRRRLQGFL
ncbi:hypothetical protein [Herbaspirillum huttiense]|uniref:RiboL-PSP-HEPN domain-containing protein n=2 Tax=Herbaspirillum huttiense TaxID=863372 RepID=A0AAJ2HFF5_9BURK|nr:hypothetical protein [Herbaspirillum huttiense]MDR9839381.1 hypothetical protein [Herbaspirillum huttiense]